MNNDQSVHGLTPELLVSRLGDYLIEKKLITEEQLHFALDRQKNHYKDQEERPRLGEILIELRYIDRLQLDHVITEQVIQFRTALETLNATLEERVEQRTHELEVALNKLAELNRLKANFISNISHELRTPLTHLQGYLELLSMSGKKNLDVDQQGYIDVMEKAFNRLEKLIQDLISFSATTHSELKLDEQDFNVNELYEVVKKKVISQAEQKQVLLKESLSHTSKFVYGDAQKILWVVQQLIENAIKFSAKEATVQFNTYDQDGKVMFEVVDNGIGIPKARLSEIFEPFHQLDGSSSRLAGGVGIGLTLAQMILEAHDSQLMVISQEGVGSTFRFLLQNSAIPLQKE